MNGSRFPPASSLWHLLLVRASAMVKKNIAELFVDTLVLARVKRVYGVAGTLSMESRT
jgi:hypothetical protein